MINNALRGISEAGGALEVFCGAKHDKYKRIGGDHLEKQGVTRYIAEYLCNNRISTKKTAEDTGISETKLRLEGNETLDADEFLMLCVYLGIRPEDTVEDI